MKQRALTEGNRTTYINMTHNRANQMTSMSSNVGRIDYKYDTNGNLASKQMGRMKDTYTYDAMDRLIGYKGYDGFEQQYTLDSYGLRTGMQQKGDTNRLTLEEKLQGKKLEEDAAAPDADEWVKTSYIYDVTLPYGQLLTETSGANITAYTYGLERLSAHSSTLKTQYTYDGRGSVAQTVANKTVQSIAYTPFGEQFGSKSTGFGFNAEWYDAATGLQNLRARQYEPAMMRFSQKDILRGDIIVPLSLNRYAYVVNDPINAIDPSGKTPQIVEMLKAAVRNALAIEKQIEKLKKGNSVSSSAISVLEAQKERILQNAIDKARASFATLSSEAQKLLNELEGSGGGGRGKSLLESCVDLLEAIERKPDEPDPTATPRPFLPTTQPTYPPGLLKLMPWLDKPPMNSLDERAAREFIEKNLLFKGSTILGTNELPDKDKYAGQIWISLPIHNSLGQVVGNDQRGVNVNFGTTLKTTGWGYIAPVLQTGLVMVGIDSIPGPLDAPFLPPVSTIHYEVKEWDWVRD